jgi:hypothetical protein
MEFSDRHRYFTFSTAVQREGGNGRRSSGAARARSSVRRRRELASGEIPNRMVAQRVDVVCDERTSLGRTHRCRRALSAERNAGFRCRTRKWRVDGMARPED